MQKHRQKVMLKERKTIWRKIDRPSSRKIGNQTEADKHAKR
jgi:hypothetical protein